MRNEGVAIVEEGAIVVVALLEFLLHSGAKTHMQTWRKFVIFVVKSAHARVMRCSSLWHTNKGTSRATFANNSHKRIRVVEEDAVLLVALLEFWLFMAN